MVEAGLAHRADEQALEPAEAPGAEHEEPGVASRLDQTSCGQVVHQSTLDVRRGVGVGGLRHERVEGLGRIGLGVAGLEVRAAVGVVLVQVAPGHDGDDRPPAVRPFRHRPCQRVRAAV